MQTPLTDNFIKNLSNPGRYTDLTTKGLHLNIRNGRKYWVFRYVLNGKRFDLGLGSYPEVALKEARNRATTSRSSLIMGQKPSPFWKRENSQHTGGARLTFREFGEQCIANKSHEWRNSKHADQWRNTIQTYANPILGDLPLEEIDTEHVLSVLSPIWYTKTETASRVRGRIEWILSAATARKLRSGQNPAAWRGHLETILPKRSKIAPVSHHAALPYEQIPTLFEKLDRMECMSALALQFLILNASRCGELIGALRSEVDKKGIWTIAAARMKAGRPHRIPLCQKSLELIERARYQDHNSPHMFSIGHKPLSNMALTMLLRRLKIRTTIHGFRSSFRDWVGEETTHSSDAAELALAHSIRNKVEAAYRRGDMLEQRRILMEDWAKYCYRDLQISSMKILGKIAA